MSTATDPLRPAGKRGRPRAGESERRRAAVIDAALAELIAHGYERTTMTGIAARAGASKETLYRWFGTKEGLFAALIEANADDSAARVAAALDGDVDPVDTLTGYATGLLTLLTSPASIALNRAAMSAPDLAEILLRSGRHRIGPLVEQHLQQLAERGHLQVDSPAEAFRLLYGLTVQDSQIRTLLGEPAPPAEEIADQARRAVEQFLRLVSAGPPAEGSAARSR